MVSGEAVNFVQSVLNGTQVRPLPSQLVEFSSPVLDIQNRLLFPCSSMVERHAVNVMVLGSSPSGGVGSSQKISSNLTMYGMEEFMPYKDRDKQLDAQSSHYKNNKSQYRERDRKRKATVQLWLLEYKSKLKCSKCGEEHPAALTFHHRDPSEKTLEISKMVSNRASKEKILEEIAKCDVLCSSCHLKVHFAESSPWADRFPVVW